MNTSTSRSRAVTEWPADLGEEKSALGAALSGQASDAVRWLRRSDFSLSANRQIFDAIAALIGQGELVIEEALLASELKVRGQLTTVGGIAYLSELGDGVILERPMSSRAKRLREFAERRRLLAASTEMKARLQDLAIPLIEIRAWLREVAG